MTSAKAHIRKSILINRRLLAEEVWASRCATVRDQVLDLVTHNHVKCCHVFLPITRNKELNTWPLVKVLHERSVSVALSVSDLDTCLMSHFEYEPETTFSLNKLQIPEPINAATADVSKIEMVLIPLLAADKKGNRIGYGKGFYDRLLSEMPKNILKVGVSLAPLFDEFDFAEVHDVKLDFCITPHQTIKCDG